VEKEKEKEKDRKFKEGRIEESVNDQEQRSSKQVLENNGMNHDYFNSFICVC
jgi:hypothetical protein